MTLNLRTADQQADRLDLASVNLGHIFWRKGKELYRIALLAGSLLIFRRFKPVRENVLLYITHAHLREMVIDLVLFWF